MSGQNTQIISDPWFSNLRTKANVQGQIHSPDQLNTGMGVFEFHDWGQEAAFGQTRVEVHELVQPAGIGAGAWGATQKYFITEPQVLLGVEVITSATTNVGVTSVLLGITPQDAAAAGNRTARVLHYGSTWVSVASGPTYALARVTTVPPVFPIFLTPNGDDQGATPTIEFNQAATGGGATTADITCRLLIATIGGSRPYVP